MNFVNLTHDWWRVRCTHPPHGYKNGHCDGQLFKVSATGAIEVKCHKCRQISIISRGEIEQARAEQFRYQPVFST